jgi:hypothetical protein
MEFGKIILFLTFATIIIYFLIKIFQRGGFKAALFDAEIITTVREVEGRRSNLGGQSTLKVHILDRDDHKLIGLEFVATTIGSYRMTPISLTPSDAQHLIQLLQQAISGRDSEILSETRSIVDKVKCPSCGHFNASGQIKCLYCGADIVSD